MIKLLCLIGFHQWAYYTRIAYHDGGGRTGRTWRLYTMDDRWCCRHQEIPRHSAVQQVPPVSYRNEIYLASENRFVPNPDCQTISVDLETTNVDTLFSVDYAKVEQRVLATLDQDYDEEEQCQGYGS